MLVTFCFNYIIKCGKMSNFIFGAGFSGFSGFSGFFGRRGLKPRLRGTIFCRSRSPDLDPFGLGGFCAIRSAGACPPRSVPGEGNPLACACGMRGPSPYGKGGVFFRSAGACPPRTLVPHSVGQDRLILTRSGSGDFALSVVRGPVLRDRCLARDRPSGYGNRPVGAVSNRAYRGFDFQFHLT